MDREQCATATRIRNVTMDDCHGCPAISRSIFSLVAGPDRAELIRHFRLMSYPARASVYREGDREPYLHIIRTGIAKLVKTGDSGVERTVRLVRPGDTVGMEMLLGDACRHTVTALTRLETCRMSADAVRAKIRQDPDLAARLFRQWQDGADNADLFLTEFSTGTAEQRVARLMLYLVSSGLGDACNLPSREEMGDMLGLTTETVSRVTAEFKRRGYLASDSERCCEVVNRDKLKELALSEGRRR